MVVLETCMALAVVVVPFLTGVLDAMAVALAEAVVVADLLTSSAKFFLNMGTLLMFVISRLMLAFS